MEVIVVGVEQETETLGLDVVSDRLDEEGDNCDRNWKPWPRMA
jgi:hypothetical protein